MAEVHTQSTGQNGRASSPVEGANEAEATLIQALESQEWVDRLADPVQAPVSGVLEGSDALRSVLDGTIAGHPAHPALVAVPVGAWTAGLVLDLLDVWGVDRRLRRGADAVHGIGLAGALTAAVFGLADWSYTGGAARRIGFIHGATNTAIAGLYGASLLARARGWRGLGVGLSTTGYGMLLFSAWLGAELIYRYGIGVSHTAFQPRPLDWTPVNASDGHPVREDEVFEGNLRHVRAGETPVLLTRVGGELRAIGDTCTHLGCSLSEGTLEGDQVRCPCHGSRFSLLNGAVAAGPAASGAIAFAVRTHEGRLEVRRTAN